MKFLREYAYQSKKEKKQNAGQKQIMEYNDNKISEGYLTSVDNSIGFLLIAD